MTYKKIIAPAGKQQRPTITSLGFKEGTELIILSIDDYKKLNLDDNKQLLETITQQNETITRLENEKNQLRHDIEELTKNNNYLVENNNELRQERDANGINKTKLDETIKELELLRGMTNETVNSLIKSNIDTAKDLIVRLDNEYKNINFIDRVFNRMSNNIDLTKYTEEITQTYNRELETTKANLLLVSAELENYNNNGLIGPGDEKQ